MFILEEYIVKKILLTAFIMLICVFTLSACDKNAQQSNNSHIHMFGDWVTVKEATCTISGKQNRSCNCGEEETRIIDALGHIEIIDTAIAATCTTDGKTEGKHCSRCNEILVAQAVLGKLGHIEVIDTAIAPTCTADGKTEGKHCLRCNEIFVAQTLLGKLGHTEVIDAAVVATCTTDGKTEGKHCSRCDETLVASKTEKALGHSYGDWSIIKYATESNEGKRVHTCTTCNISEYSVIDIIRYDGSLGSAGKISDSTLIVSIFANDSGTFWDFSSAEDHKTINTMYEHLSSAVDWLEKECQKYGAETKFVFDWTRYSDLFYSFDFSHMNMVRADGGEYKTQCAYIQNHIDSEKLKQKYNTQNIIYIFYFNTDEHNTINSWCLSDIQNCDIEVINVFVRDDYPGGYYLMHASGFAHEILHCFGAYDLYYASDTIPQAYVDYCKQTNSKDIMYAVNLGREIRMIFTDLCAYYVGLINTCDDVIIWGLSPSTHTIT